MKSRIIELEPGMSFQPYPCLPYALEALPQLLGKGELATLKRALFNATPNAAPREKNETEGEHIARLIRIAANQKFERAA